MAAVAKDPAIKLFGRTISLPETLISDDSEYLDNESSMMTKAETEDRRNETCGTIDEAASLEPCQAKQPQTSLQQSLSSKVSSQPEGHNEESDDSGEPNPSKRPDKIVPCPRCHSSDTKFCYFNNYNVNQPRHFCKSCQRYWTAGGTVRNVPVGAGRRRNKHLSSQFRHLVASSDGGATTVVDTSDPRTRLLSCEQSSSSCTTSSPNEMVLKFGPESPHCESTPNLLNQSQINGCSGINHGNYDPYEKEGLPCHSPSSGSSIGTRVINSNLSLQQPLYHCNVPMPPQVTSRIPNSSSCGPFLVPGCTQSTPNISVQFVPAPYWNYIPVWVAGSGNMSLAVSNKCASSPFLSSGNGMQVLGKHPRDATAGEITGDCVSSSKTLRITDYEA
ncbi:hypothetical protein RND81_13G077200 [Saponaria officinalis]|uniref:Dof-type domain-containing protein n=1 Tax=Saponaria officinalis TaxID=3572 RepID=A0AAW1H3L4_SAPOF